MVIIIVEVIFLSLFQYFPYIILAFFTLKFIILFINENIIALKNQIKCQQIDNGILSIKDIQSDNIDRFSICCEDFLKLHGYTNISKLYSNSNSIEFISTLENKSVFIRCISSTFTESSSIDDQYLETSQNELELLLGKMTFHSCNDGVIISNSNFSPACLNFLNENINPALKNHIKLIDGYTLTKFIRDSRKSNIISEDLI